MRTLTAVLGFGAIVIILLAGAFVALAFELLPYAVLGIVIGAVIQGRRRQQARVYRHPIPPPRPRPLPPGGWVYVPVWVGPPPQPLMPVIEAEFIRDSRG
ncbi:hypothetical protein [Mycolicibacterium moriokaense]|uniref:Uncharacterized protein n=1 Tax=Mycolicibacterium moriokaense TaxID=39691 RepID=A0A318HQ15_9MYCO|nr:hypothetical protein [Mycolicibacterium moriokaense]PXX06382.1 hypothetical protein C8E89_114155 [Mycolicibacterium moriokaense]